MMTSELEEIVDDIRDHLDDKDTVRELAMKSSRAIRRLSRSMVKKIHNGQEPHNEFKEAVNEVSKIKSIVEEYPELYYAGFLRNGFQELAEAHLFWALSSDKEIKTPEELDITAGAYLIGLADVVGELRRMALDEMTEGDIEKAEELLRKMEKMKDMLMELDYPNAIVPIKNKQDMARSLVEKTRGDIAGAARQEKLSEDIKELQKTLEDEL